MRRRDQQSGIASIMSQIAMDMMLAERGTHRLRKLDIVFDYEEPHDMMMRCLSAIFNRGYAAAGGFRRKALRRGICSSSASAFADFRFRRRPVLYHDHHADEEHDGDDTHDHRRNDHTQLMPRLAAQPDRENLFLPV